MNFDGLEVIRAANLWLGTPYRHQASLKGVGCDCLGLIRGIWLDIYGFAAAQIPPYAQFGRDEKGAMQLLDGAKQYLQPVQNATLPGRVVLFQLNKKIPPRHCGIILENNNFIHAQERHGVVTTSMTTSWQRRIHSTYAFPKR